VVSGEFTIELRKAAKADPSLTTPKLRPKKHKSLFGDPENYVWAPFSQDDTAIGRGFLGSCRVSVKRSAETQHVAVIVLDLEGS